MKLIEIGGKERPVKYTMNAIIEFDELTGIDLTSGINGDQLKKAKNLRALIFVGLKHGLLEESKEIDFTIEDVGKWVSFGDGSVVKFMEVVNSDSKSDKPAEEGESSGKKSDGGI